ncbi:EH signature domain-containing protein [Fundidesulfovibrio soli]|uniref:EH signature domain-containing protein n=1 Tax=Fundidesulfovibrio soli TaxID=2922716 RepID=UPI001FAFEFDA|nr:EH signature domain-containing protein [Fundidesulfovibrio soli]
MSLTLKDILKAWQNPVCPIRSMEFPTSKAVEAARRIGEGVDRQTKPPIDLSMLRTKIVQAAKSKDFSAFDVLDWRYSTMCLDKESGLLEEMTLLQAYLGALAQRAKGRILRGLARVYVHVFSSFPSAASILAAFLASRADAMGRRWADPAKKYHLFNPDQVVASLARHLLRQDVDASHGYVAALDQAGLPPGIAVSELGISIFQAALRQASKQGNRLDSQEVAQRIIDLSSNGEGGLALQGANLVVREVTNALLMPFRATKGDETIRNRVKTFLLNKLHDPRLDRALWLPVREEAKAVMHGWLTEQSLELFLGIVDRVSDMDEDARRMWQMRGKFWRAYHRKGFINEAWVVLGVNGVREARRINLQADSPLGQALSYAELTYSTDIMNHIVLIMKIDNLVVVDWSHNGRCHIWSDRNKYAPALYRPRYSKNDLTQGSEKPGPYTHYAGGTWRENVAEHIRRETGRRVLANDYR